jgi:hypothetical protein
MTTTNERYADLAEWRRWFRFNPTGRMFAERWADLRAEWDAERRKLVLVRWRERRHEGHRDAGDPDCNLCVAAWDFYGRVTA